MRKWLQEWFFETPDFSLASGIARIWFMACTAICLGTLGTWLTWPHRWQVIPATLCGGLLGLVLAASVMRAQARRLGLPLVPRAGRARIYLDMPKWRFVLGAAIPINLTVELLGEECWVHRPIWEFSAHSWHFIAHDSINTIIMWLIGRWFLQYALKDRDVWGVKTTKGRIAPAQRVG